MEEDKPVARDLLNICKRNYKIMSRNLNKKSFWRPSSLKDLILQRETNELHSSTADTSTLDGKINYG